MDRAPMLALTGQGATTRLHKESHQIMDVVEMFTPITKWATTILNGNTIPEITRKAVRIARTEKPGAVHIELPEDVAQEQTDVQPLPPKRFRRSVPDDKIVDRAFNLICAIVRRCLHLQARVQPRDCTRNLTKSWMLLRCLRQLRSGRRQF